MRKARKNKLTCSSIKGVLNGPFLSRQILRNLAVLSIPSFMMSAALPYSQRSGLC